MKLENIEMEIEKKELVFNKETLSYDFDNHSKGKYIKDASLGLYKNQLNTKLNLINQRGTHVKQLLDLLGKIKSTEAHLKFTNTTLNIMDEDYGYLVGKLGSKLKIDGQEVSKIEFKKEIKLTKETILSYSKNYDEIVKTFKTNINSTL